MNTFPRLASALFYLGLGLYIGLVLSRSNVRLWQLLWR